MKFGAAILLILPFFCFSQNIRVNTYDKFLKKHRIELEPVAIPLSGKGKVSIGFTSIASTLYLELSGYGWGASTIDTGNDLILLFANDSIVTAKSSGLQSFEPGLKQNTYKHQYHITSADLELLSRNELLGMRKYSFKDFSDISIPREYIPKIRSLSSLFLNELKKANVLKTLKYINLKDIGNYIGDSVQFCSKIYSARYFESSENGPTLLDVQADFSDRLVNAVVWQQDRKNFGDGPEKIYVNKDVCISGMVTLVNNVPYLVIHQKNQIKVKTPVTLNEVGFFVGDTVTVTGTVFTTKYFSETQNLPTLLNMGAPFPDQLLTVVIENGDRKNFNESPEVFYLQKEVRVIGKVMLYKNKPQIIVRSPEQITITGENGFMEVSSKSSVSAPVQKPPVRTTETQKTNNSFITPAQFPGGSEALMDFLSKNLECPDELKASENKTVLASFLVNADGSLSDIQITQSAGKAYDKEVLRVLKKMPQWRPKSQNGLAMATTVSQPITFRRVEAEQ